MNSFRHSKDGNYFSVEKVQGDYKLTYDVDVNVNGEHVSMYAITLTTAKLIHKEFCKEIESTLADTCDIEKLFEPWKIIGEPWKDLNEIAIEDDEIIP